MKKLKKKKKISQKIIRKKLQQTIQRYRKYVIARVKIYMRFKIVKRAFYLAKNMQ